MIGSALRNKRRNGTPPRKRPRIFTGRLVDVINNRDGKIGRPALPEEIIAASLYNTGGMITHTARQLGCTHGAISTRVSRSKYLQEVKRNTIVEFIDLCESQLRKKVTRGNMTAIIFALKCLAKDRGYVERHEFIGKVDYTHTGGVLLLPQPSHDLNSWTELAEQWDQRQLPAPDDDVEDAEFEEE